MEEQAKFEQWAIVELMGHTTIAGYVTEQSIAGAALLRIDVPAVGNQAGFTKFVSAGAIFSISPTTQEIAERAAQRLSARPVDLYLVAPPALAHGAPVKIQIMDTLGDMARDGEEGYPEDGLLDSF